MSKKIKVKDKDLQVFGIVPTLTEKQIERTVEKQVKFLKAVYPWLNELETYSEGAMEIRPIKRDVENLKKENAELKAKIDDLIDEINKIKK